MPTLSEEEQDKRFKELDDAFTTFEDIYLKDQKFLCGDEITIADLFCANEVRDIKDMSDICPKDLVTVIDHYTSLLSMSINSNISTAL